MLPFVILFNMNYTELVFVFSFNLTNNNANNVNYYKQT